MWRLCLSQVMFTKIGKCLSSIIVRFFSIMKVKMDKFGNLHSSILTSLYSLASYSMKVIKPVCSLSMKEYYNPNVDMESKHPVIWVIIPYNLSSANLQSLNKSDGFDIIGIIQIATPKWVTFNHAAKLDNEDSMIVDTFVKYLSKAICIWRASSK